MENQKIEKAQMEDKNSHSDTELQKIKYQEEGSLEDTKREESQTILEVKNRRDDFKLIAEKGTVRAKDREKRVLGKVKKKKLSGKSTSGKAEDQQVPTPLKIIK